MKDFILLKKEFDQNDKALYKSLNIIIWLIVFTIFYWGILIIANLRNFLLIVIYVLIVIGFFIFYFVKYLTWMSNHEAIQKRVEEKIKKVYNVEKLTSSPSIELIFKKDIKIGVKEIIKIMEKFEFSNIKFDESNFKITAKNDFFILKKPVSPLFHFLKKNLYSQKITVQCTKLNNDMFRLKFVIKGYRTKMLDWFVLMEMKNYLIKNYRGIISLRKDIHS